ncbi:MAG: undecaprenyl-diphosphatase [Candidatus Omnitrophica bacterium CG11_big_fil_rev_8_21_14_0_20_41_12]|nr:MAG: undecaprenyl-diphosphatase [Candidatus Omnitrophica bacterium CG11_big_fil_rev_8_21_14_0_20_41_12]
MNNIINLILIFGAKYLFLFVVVIALVWFSIQLKPRKKEILFFACICLPLAFIIFKIAGYLYYNPRPFVDSNFIPLVYHAADNGFPSHHTFLVSVISAVVFVFSRRLGFVLWILALLVGFSRVYVGVHHMIDIVASILISILSAGAVYFLRKIRGGIK